MCSVSAQTRPSDMKKLASCALQLRSSAAPFSYALQLRPSVTLFSYAFQLRSSVTASSYALKLALQSQGSPESRPLIDAIRLISIRRSTVTRLIKYWCTRALIRAFIFPSSIAPSTSKREPRL